MENKKPYRIILSGGGTGGHIFPAVAVANYIKEHYPDAEILFVGAKGRMEMKRIPEAGYKIIGLNISGLQRRLTLENLLFPLKVISSYLASLKIIKDFEPDVVVGFGGYASSPITMAAARKKVPILLQEQNSYAGLANKTVAKRASMICVAYEQMEKFFEADKIVITGNPVRDSIARNAVEKTVAMSDFNLNSDKKTILVIGGSLGARTLNESIVQNLQKLKDASVNVIWQTGSFYYQEMLERSDLQENDLIKPVEFISNMEAAYAAADIVISRAGALSVSELCIAGKPVVFVPSPNVAEDHQTKNAMALVNKQAADIVPDKEATETLVDKALEMLDNTDRMDELSKNIKAMALPNATADIANKVIELIK
ncbi:MAG: undecaprenyldiphospho-muramoylpentapeptide beta-N-acetylglucosaminyltransferase [Bacteroidota bacterium]